MKRLASERAATCLLESTISLPEAASSLGISEEAMRKRVDRGAFPVIRVGRAVRVPRQVIDEIHDGKRSFRALPPRAKKQKAGTAS